MRRRPRSIPPSTALRSPQHYFTFINVVCVIVVVCRSSRIIEIQSRMSERALELLALPDGEPKYILDIGCGSGLSGDVIEEHGHMWVGVDISPSMLGSCYLTAQFRAFCNLLATRHTTTTDVAAERGVDDGDVCQSDMGHGLPFRAGSFDGAIRFVFLLQSSRVCRFLQARVLCRWSCRVVCCVACAIMCAAFRPCSGCATRTRRATFHRGA